jgi:hypothetical protein
MIGGAAPDLPRPLPGSSRPAESMTASWRVFNVFVKYTELPSTPIHRPFWEASFERLDADLNNIQSGNDDGSSH